MEKSVKTEVVSWVKDELTNSDTVVLIRKTGITGNDMAAFRHDLCKEGVKCRIVKNSLLKIGIDGTRLSSFSEHTKGPTALLYSDNFSPLTKLLTEFVKDHEVEIVAGVMGKQLLTTNDVKALAELPSLEELRGKLVALVQTPATGIARIVKEPGSRVARVLGARK